MISFNQNAVSLLCILVGFVYSQRNLDDVCTLKSTGLQGVCKFIKDCPSAQEELQQHHVPQICSFHRFDPIICCPPVRKPGEISKKKCEEYSAYVNETYIPPIGLIDAEPVTSYECGHTVETLIVGGTEAQQKEFPHMAAIGYGSSIEDAGWFCGGTLLSDEYVLTAAHCLSNQNWGDAKWVKLGVTRLTSTHRKRQHIEVAELIPHPKYKAASHYYDIGLLKLKKLAKLNSFSRPACLYSKEEITAEKAIATGWGQTEFGGTSSNDLLKVTLELTDPNACTRLYRPWRRLQNGILSESQICAGSQLGNDTCQGDSGGPLQIYHIHDDIKCMYDIIGVVSFGKSCYGSPGVYTRVSYYIKWIEDIVWP
ncbi:serine protease snake-like [Zophobas morio]|uniref:serine protease snake-like n=1 Tax=Zophobas morio TaxID=2755281 RepID=UPI003082CD3B